VATVSKSKKQSTAPSIDEVAIEHSAEIVGEYVRPRLVPLSWLERQLGAALWQRNAKLHDIGGLYESMQEYGFIDHPKWDAALNSGKGGIVIGNGRTKTIVQLLIEAKSQGKEPPRGIPYNAQNGEWYIPIGFGVDQASQAKAEALGIDHNHLTLSGSDFTGFDYAKLWRQDEYIALLTSIAEEGMTPITVDESAIASLLSGLSGENDSESFGGDDSSTKEINPDEFDLQCRCPKCGFEFDAKKQ
jgi:hypothetical protein